MKINILSTISYDVSHKESLGFLIRINNFKLLLDCGPYIPQILNENFSFRNNIDAVFISHDHVDHAIGLPWLLNSIVYDEYYKIIDKRTTPIKLIIPNNNESAILKYLKQTSPWMFIKCDYFHAIIEDPSNKPVILDEDLIIESFKLKHSIENWGITIKHGNKKICYISDTLITKQLGLDQKIKDCDLVIFNIGGSSKEKKMCNDYAFATSKEAALLCKSSNVKKVLFTHVFHQYDLKNVVSEATEILGNERVLPISSQEIII